MYCTVRNLSKGGIVLASNCMVADTYFKRLIGLQFKEFKNFDGLLLKPCKMIHTCFMKMKIDVLFIDKEDRVLHMKSGMKPWKMTTLYPTAKYVIELPYKTIKKTKTSIGDKIKIDYKYYKK